MKLEKECINCRTLMKFEEKDIKRLTKQEKKDLEERNKPYKKLLDEEETIGWLSKKKVKSYTGFARSMVKAVILEAYGHIVCPVCKTDQFLAKEEKLSK